MEKQLYFDVKIGCLCLRDDWMVVWSVLAYFFVFKDDGRLPIIVIFKFDSLLLRKSVCFGH